ncbi:MAG: sigma-54-dependent Fis family transcriptional regulator, partial [Myxococcales bacterium]|nr:sigma-54-dependent Fis family transcriptional regulator [Myxococcales bacterium]
DEIGELPLDLQPNLLRVLETRRVRRVGGSDERDVDVRIVAATNRLEGLGTEASPLRLDLYHRVAAVVVTLPPLRVRRDDILELAEAFLDEVADRFGRRKLTADARDAMWRYDWPGNVRELRHVLEYVVAAYDDALLEPWHLEERLGAPVGPGTPALAALVPTPTGFRPIEAEVRELESARMRAALAATGGNQRRAAQLIEMPLRTFVTKLARYGLKG